MPTEARQELCCAHCGLVFAAETGCSAEIDGQSRAFCCHGCRLAYQIVCGAGLGSYYRTRQLLDPGLPGGAYSTSYSDEYLARFVTTTADGARLPFLVEGVRCASCVWVIERILERLDGVRQVQLNYGTHRAQVLFDPERIGPGAILAELNRIGYVARPSTSDEARHSAAREGRTLLIRFGTAALFSMQVMGFTLPLYAGYFQGIDPTTRQTMSWLAGLTALPVVFYAGWPFLRGAWRSLRHGTANMDLLVALGVLVTFFYSCAALWQGGEIYFDTAAMIVTLILLGRLLEHFARQRAIGRIDRLLQLAPEEAQQLVDGTARPVPSSDLHPGDVILVRPGERFPVDGELLDGTTEIDESAVTGEPLPILCQPGATVAAGTVNLLGAVTVRVQSTTADSLLARIARLVEEALARRAPIQRLADSTAAVFVPVVLAVALLTAGGWQLSGATPGDSLLRAVAVLVVACPCALGLATPMAILVATGAGAARGIVFRGGDVLEQTGRIRCVAFDKTGTLTTGQPRLVHFQIAPQVTETEFLATAAQAAVSSAHPLAVGILATLREDYGIAAPPPRPATAVPGRGVLLSLGDEPVRMGNREFLAEAGIVCDEVASTALTEVHLARGGRYLGSLQCDDPLREEVPAVRRSLQALHLHSAILTGDRLGTARRLADQAGIAEVAAQLTPAAKAAWVEAREGRGEPVLMVGDGINDAPALAAATVGCALAGGTAVALEASDLILTRPSLQRLVEALQLARKCGRIIRQNLFWAFIYNILAIPLAIGGGLAPIHAAAAMALSSLCVVANSLRLAAPMRGLRCSAP